MVGIHGKLVIAFMWKYGSEPRIIKWKDFDLDKN